MEGIDQIGKIDREFTVTMTVERLRQLGAKTTRLRLMRSIMQDGGPVWREARTMFGQVERIIDWESAKRWAGVEGEVPDDEDAERLAVADQIILHLKRRHPKRWQQFGRLPGRDRIYLLNQIVDDALVMAEGFFLESNLTVNTPHKTLRVRSYDEETFQADTRSRGKQTSDECGLLSGQSGQDAGLIEGEPETAMGDQSGADAQAGP